MQRLAALLLSTMPLVATSAQGGDQLPRTDSTHVYYCGANDAAQITSAPIAACVREPSEFLAGQGSITVAIADAARPVTYPIVDGTATLVSESPRAIAYTMLVDGVEVWATVTYVYEEPRYPGDGGYYPYSLYAELPDGWILDVRQLTLH